ncbi:MAG: DNA topoisomerase I [Nitrososphaerales archaeon]
MLVAAKGVETPSAAARKAGGAVKWSTLKHNGVAFPPPYEPHNLALTVRGKKIRLTPKQEEMAWAWAKKKDTPYVKDKVFASNFLSDFRKVLPPEYSDLKMEEIDFSDIIRYQEEEKEWKSRPEVKKKLAAERKKRREGLKERYGSAEIDGHRVEVANYMVEPPGIFMGRGKHPLRGRWKPRVYPEDVTLNLGEDAPKPPSKWSKMVHDHQSMWLASWVDKLTKKVKYVWLHDSSHIRQQRDKMKYDYAKKLESKLGRVRMHTRRGMSSKDEKVRKIAAVCYLIDKLCMRVGDEKDEDEADTVGASTLRVEHINLTSRTIQFDFLGKDSVPWSKSISVGDEDSRLFRKNLETFMAGKKKGEPVFDGVRSSDANRFLGRAMKGLTAKVFRTFHATNVTSSYLLRYSDCKEDSDFLKIYHAKLANLETAITCNHKRTPPKNWEQSLAKKQERLEKIKAKTPKTEKAKIRRGELILKAKLAIQIAKETRDYNLNTSLRNYIDPRIYKSWSDYVDLDWRKIYTKTLQRKFSWATRSNIKWPQSR